MEEYNPPRRYVVDGAPDDLPPGHSYVVRRGLVDADGTQHLDYVDLQKSAGPRIPFRSFEVFGTTWSCEVDRSGDFIARLSGSQDTVRAGTYVDVQNKAKVVAKQRRAKISVEFTQVQADGTVRNGTVTGLHLGNGNKLVRWDDGTTEQFEPRWDQPVYPRLGKEHAARVSELLKASHQAKRAYDTYERSLRRDWSFDSVVQQAISRAKDQVSDDQHD